MDDNPIVKRILAVVLLLVTCCFVISANARSFTMVNNCSFPIWFGFSGDLPLPSPADGNFQLAANGGRKIVDIPSVEWRGVIAGRTNCTSASCETADCGNGGGPCIHGFNQPATQAEFKLLPRGKDSYYVEAINGVNLGISIIPSVASIAGNPYFCGSPGAVTPSAGLSACLWQFSPPSAEYNLVANGGNACVSDSDCSSGSICGVSFNPGQHQMLQKTCGRKLGFWNPNWVTGVQPTFKWLKKECPTLRTNPYDDTSNAFTCSQDMNGLNAVNYIVTFCPQAGSVGDEPARDSGILNLRISSNSDKKCSDAIDTLFVDDQNVENFSVILNDNIYKGLNVGLHKIRLKSLQGIPDKNHTGICRSTLDVPSVLIKKNKISSVVATFQFSVPVPEQKFNYLVIVGSPFSPVVINGSITCPDKDNTPRCLIADQTVGSTMTIKGKQSNYCGLQIRDDGGMNISPDSVNCFVDILPASPSADGQVSLPSGF